MSILDSTADDLSVSNIHEGLANVVASNTALNLSPQLSPINQLVIIDSGIDNYVQLAEALVAESAVLVLDTNTDGLAQIDSFIHQFQDLSALHIVSHGSSGQLELGSTNLNSDTLASYKNMLERWDDVLTDTADILLYGCNVGEGASGDAFLDQFSQLTGADIAASTDITGNSQLGGDWDLEFTLGSLESNLVFNADVTQAYSGVLANDYVVQTDPAFQKELVLSGLQEPIDIEFLPDGRMLFLQKNGVIQLFDPNTANATPQVYLDITSRIKGGAESGLLSITLDPDFATNNYFYIYYSDKGGAGDADDEYRITRFTHDGSVADSDSEFVVYRKPGVVRGHHDGGGLSFGPDGKLYLTLGDHEPSRTADPSWAPEQIQDLTNVYGKILRINKDGTIPSDNPFADGAGGNLDEIWARGLRNPYRSKWDIEGNRFFIGDVGGNVQSTAFEEINLGQAGGNYGWPNVEGVTGDPTLVDPLFFYDHTGSTPNGGAVTAGVAYRGSQFPSEYEGAFFYGDYVLGWLRYLKFDTAGNIIDANPTTPEIDAFNFDNSAGTVVSIDQAPDGSLYYAEIAENFSGPGNIYRITYNVDNQLPVIDAATSDVTEGQGPLTVNFSASATDSDDDPLTYVWSFGNGSTATGAIASNTYDDNGVYTAFLQVSDGMGTVNSSPIEIQVGNRPDITALTTSLNSSGFRAGEIITLNANATDSDGSIARYEWDIDFIHNAHVHPEDNQTGSSITFEIPTVGHGYSDVTGYRFALTVTDADGLTDVQTIDLLPEKVDLSFSSNVPGNISYKVDGLPRIGTSFLLDQAIDFQQKIGVPAIVTIDGIEYTFDSWSDGMTTFPVEYITDSLGEVNATFDLTVPDENRSYSATYLITNVAANAVGDNFVVAEDASEIMLDVLANDAGSTDASLTITKVGSTLNGGVVSINNTNDGLIYTPASDFAGVETFTYSISDSNGNTSQGNVKISIEGANDAPIAVADSFVVPLESTGNALDVLGNDQDPDITNGLPASMNFVSYEVIEVSTVSSTRAVKVKHLLSDGGLEDVPFVFDATPDASSSGSGPDPHFHMMGMPVAMRPAYLTQHNAGGTGELINFLMEREDKQAFAFEGFSYTSGQFFAGTNAAFTVIGTLANGGEVSQTFAPAAAETIFQATTLSDAAWKNVTSVRFRGSANRNWN